LQINLKCEDGGLGITSPHISRFAAYAASITTCLPTIINMLNIFKNEQIHVEDFYQIDINSINLLSNNSNQSDLKRLFQDYFLIIQRFYQCDVQFTIKQFLTTLVNEKRLQKFLSDVIYDQIQQNYFNKIKESDSDTSHLNPNDKSRLANIVTNIGEENCKWITCLPKFTAYEIPNNEYQSALLRRLYLIQPFIPNNVTCTCQGKPLIDPEGRHSTSCPIGGNVQRTSKNIENTLVYIANYSGCRTISQEKHNFTLSVGNENRLPDVTIFDAPGHPHNKLLIDVSVIQSFVGSKNATQNPSLPFNFYTKIIEDPDSSCREAHRRFNQKKSDYQQISNENGHHFLPFIMETNGYIHNSSKNLLKRLSEKAAILHSIPSDNLYKYFTTLLSVSLQRSISQAIINTSARLNVPFFNHFDFNQTYEDISTYNQNVFGNNDNLD